MTFPMSLHRYLKADMKSYIQLEMAAIFSSSEPLSKTGYLGVCRDLLHLHWLTRPVRCANRELQNEIFLPTVGFELGTFRLRRERVKG